ncbi:helix-turn-helix domain-containing protein [Microbacterium sp. NPDC089698]|uniref:helix-turn-helix domain-containing protein n=1 Tax=Microbacterium sp. NPDC089698 TaxID=3364200 RepID=UPI0038116375
MLIQAQGENVTRIPSLKVTKTGTKRLSPETNAAIAVDYRTGMGVREIARKYGINETTAHRRLERVGVEKRPYAIGQDTINAILALKATGLSYKEIGLRVGVSDSSVRNMLIRHGV